MNRIKIVFGDTEIPAELNNSPTAEKVWNALPLEGWANLWGEEIYFEIPVSAQIEADARAEVEAGELGYWPVGRAFCIFFGPTPASSNLKPRAASPVNIIGLVSSDLSALHTVKDGDSVTLVSGE